MIRGHHLDNFASFQRLNWTPKEMASLQAVVTRRQDSESYIRDVLGDSEKTTERFIESTRRVFEQYVQLPDKAPITITVGAPDGICSSCILGDHCRANEGVLLTEGREAPYYLRFTQSDVLAVKKFEAISMALALTNTLSNEGLLTSEIDHVLTTPEQKDVYAVPVTAPASYVKTLLLYWELDKF